MRTRAAVVEGQGRPFTIAEVELDEPREDESPAELGPVVERPSSESERGCVGRAAAAVIASVTTFISCSPSAPTAFA